MSTERDELAEVIHGRICEESLSDCLEYWGQCLKAAEAILAAGYSKPRTISSVAGLDALPVESVILSNHGEDSAQKDDAGYWYLWGGDVGLVAEEITLPATVLYSPDVAQ